MIPITQIHVPAPITFTLPDAYPALLTGEAELYTVVDTTNITQLQLGEEVIATASGMRRRLLPLGVPITVTPGEGGGVLHVTKPGAALPGLALTPIAPSRAECGVLGGDDDTESGVTSYAVTFTPLRPPGSAPYPDVRIRLGTTTLPADAVIEVARANGTVVATLALQEQVKDQLGKRWGFLRGAWSYGFSGEAFTCTLKRAGGGTFTGNVTPLSASGDYEGYDVGFAFNTLDGVTVQRTAFGDTEAWPACPQIQFGSFPPLMGAMRGPTAARPAYDIGNQPWIDTDLGRPIWRLPDGTWIESSGAAAGSGGGGTPGGGGGDAPDPAQWTFTDLFERTFLGTDYTVTVGPGQAQPYLAAGQLVLGENLPAQDPATVYARARLAASAWNAREAQIQYDSRYTGTSTIGGAPMRPKFGIRLIGSSKNLTWDGDTLTWGASGGSVTVLADAAGNPALGVTLRTTLTVDETAGQVQVLRDGVGLVDVALPADWASAMGASGQVELLHESSGVQGGSATTATFDNLAIRSGNGRAAT